MYIKMQLLWYVEFLFQVQPMRIEEEKMEFTNTYTTLWLRSYATSH